MTKSEDKALFWGCWIALVATSFAFIARVFTQGEWGAEFGLSATQQGEIYGVGLWPFAISIIVFSLVMDKIGYKSAMLFGFACHILSGVLTYFSTGYTSLYVATFIMALGNGTVEAYINPVVATMFNKEKSRYLNYLHGGWSGGFVIGGLLLLILIPGVSWRIKMLIPMIPAIIYFIILIKKEFPVGESAAAGVPWKDTLREVGGIGFFLMAFMIFSELLRSTGLVTENPMTVGAIIGAIIGIAATVYLKSLFGRPMFLLLLVLMIPLATTELGIDSWFNGLMEPAMGEMAVWLFVYISAVMTVMRFLAGPVIRALTPLGTLAVAAGGAFIALTGLSIASSAALIFVFGTLYGMCKAYFWPTTLGVVGEQFPRGGAMTINGISGFGLLGVGILGAVMLGSIQDNAVDSVLAEQAPAIHDQVTEERFGIYGPYNAVVADKVAALSPADQAIVSEAQDGSTKTALSLVAFLPLLMMIVYIGLIMYFRSRGGYKPVDIVDELDKVHPATEA